MRSTRYYDSKLKASNPDALQALKLKRKAKAEENSLTPEQLADAETIKLKRAGLLKRGIET